MITTSLATGKTCEIWPGWDKLTMSTYERCLPSSDDHFERIDYNSPGPVQLYKLRGFGWGVGV